MDQEEVPILDVARISIQYPITCSYEILIPSDVKYYLGMDSEMYQSDKYICIEQGINYVSHRGFNIPTQEGHIKWNTDLILKEKSYRIIPAGSTIIYFVAHIMWGDRGIISLDQDLKVHSYLSIISSIPYIDQFGYVITYTEDQHIPIRDRGIVQFHLIHDGEYILPVNLKHYRNSENIQVICQVESRGNIPVPEMESCLDAVIFMLSTKSICYEFKGYEDVRVECIE